MSDQVQRQAMDRAEDAAARWALRYSEGFTATDERDFQTWLAENPAHETLFAEYRGAWDRFTPIEQTTAAPSAVHVSQPTRARSPLLKFAVPVLAAVAAIAVVITWQRPAGSRVADTTPVKSTIALPVPCQQRTLEDGTQVDLNRGAELSVAFTPTERRVTLLRGEATFMVAKDASRPFVVTAGDVEARAIGTAFNVRRGAGAVDVVVTEGIVRVDDIAGQRPSGAEPVLLTASQQITVASHSSAARAAITTLDNLQVAQQLAWRPRWLDFDDTPLSEIVAAFNRHNPVALKIATPELAAERMTAKFRSDNVENFVRVLERVYHVRSTLRGGEVELSR